MVIDEQIAIEWARIPHFYYDFYVFQYATGLFGRQWPWPKKFWTRESQLPNGISASYLRAVRPTQSPCSRGLVWI